MTVVHVKMAEPDHEVAHNAIFSQNNQCNGLNKAYRSKQFQVVQPMHSAHLVDNCLDGRVLVHQYLQQIEL